MKYAKGVCWVEDTRIPFKETDKFDIRRYDTNSVFRMDNPQTTYEVNNPNTKGRFTPNLLVCDDMLNDGKKYGNLFQKDRNKDVDGGSGNSLVRAHKQGESNGVFDNGTSSSRFYDLDMWFDKMIEKL